MSEPKYGYVQPYSDEALQREIFPERFKQEPTSLMQMAQNSRDSMNLDSRLGFTKATQPTTYGGYSVNNGNIYDNTKDSTGLFGIGTDKQWAQYGGLGVDLLNTGLAFAGFNEAKKNNSAKRALLNQQIESNRYAMQNKKNIQNAFTV